MAPRRTSYGRNANQTRSPPDPAARSSDPQGPRRGGGQRSGRHVVGQDWATHGLVHTPANRRQSFRKAISWWGQRCFRGGFVNPTRIALPAPSSFPTGTRRAGHAGDGWTCRVFALQVRGGNCPESRTSCGASRSIRLAFTASHRRLLPSRRSPIQFAEIVAQHGLQALDGRGHCIVSIFMQ